MLKIDDLEAKWLRYKIKSYTPRFIVSFFIFLGVLFFIFFDLPYNFILEKQSEIFSDHNHNTLAKNDLTTLSETKKNSDSEGISEDVNIDTSKKKKIVQTHDEITLSPSMNFIQSIRQDTPIYYDKEKTNKKVSTKSQVAKKEAVIHSPRIEEIVLKTDVTKKETSEINIKRKNTQKDIEDVIERFKKSNNPVLSLFIAKKYYELKDYRQAYNYALTTNELNNKIEDSWIVFAKSLYMLQGKYKAIEILNKYIAESNSQKAKILLENIKSGKLQ